MDGGQGLADVQGLWIHLESKLNPKDVWLETPIIWLDLMPPFRLLWIVFIPDLAASICAPSVSREADCRCACMTQQQAPFMSKF